MSVQEKVRKKSILGFILGSLLLVGEKLGKGVGSEGEVFEGVGVSVWRWESGW